MTPYRVLDTRKAIGVRTTTPVPAGGTLTVDVTGTNGTAGVPATGVSAVMATVTVVGGTASGYLVGWGSGTPRPGSSTINWSDGRPVATTTIIPVGADGRVALADPSGASTHVVVDVEGWYAAGTVTTPGGYRAIAPARVLDTRRAIGVATTTPLGGRTTTRVRVTTSTDASAVVLTVTATGGTSNGSLAVGGAPALPFGGPFLIWGAGRTVATMVIAPVNADGTVQLYVEATGTVHLVADLLGSYLVRPLEARGTTSVDAPRRIVDTRQYHSGPGASLTPNSERRVGTDSTSGGSGSVGAVVVIVTVTSTTGTGYLVAYPSDTTRPATSMINWSAGQTLSTTVVLPVDAAGDVSFSNISRGQTDLVVDLVGTVIAWDTPTEASGWTAQRIPGVGAPGKPAVVLDVACADGASCVLSATTAAPQGRSGPTGVLLRYDDGQWSPPTTVPANWWGSPATACAPSSLCVSTVASPDNTGRYPSVARSTRTSPWKVEPLLPPVDGGLRPTLLDAACPASGTTCWVLGQVVDPVTSTVSSFAAVTEGAGWQVHRIPPLVVGDELELERIACLSDDDCSAVGGLIRPNGYWPAAAHWDGRSWSSVPVPSTGPSDEGGLHTLAANGDRYVATGNLGGYGVVATGDRTGWTTSSVPLPVLPQLACPARAASLCVASTSYRESGGDEDVIMSVPDPHTLPLVYPASRHGAPRVPSSASCGSQIGCVFASPTEGSAVGERGFIGEARDGVWIAGPAPTPPDGVEGSPVAPPNGPYPGPKVACWGTSGCLYVTAYRSHDGTQVLKAVTRADAR